MITLACGPVSKEDALAAYGRLREFVRAQEPGSCKVLSQGMECKCPLCDIESLYEYVPPYAPDPVEAVSAKELAEQLYNVYPWVPTGHAVRERALLTLAKYYKEISDQKILVG